MKTCFKCQKIKPYAAFYKHESMADGYCGKCKECTKSDVTANYYRRIDHYKAYKKEWLQRPHVKAYRKRAHENYKQKYPEKYIARTAVNNAIRDGRLMPKPCVICGDNEVHGHHEDYSKPLEVVWLCPRHHKDAHGNHG
jgi:hypothetical protein